MSETVVHGVNMTVKAVERQILSNGLEVLVQEDRRAPVVAYHTWFSVGSRHEQLGRTGMAHLFEHLMFKETTNLSEGEFDRKMEAAGARTNAATWADWTYYYEKLPAEKVELAFELEAERMAHMVLGPSQLSSEREVVMNERRLRVDNDPDGKIYETLYAARYGAEHPYGWPTIGWMKDIEAITLEDCLSFYDTFYAPNNATVVIVGDLDSTRAFELAEQYYGDIPSREIPTRDWPEPTPIKKNELEMTLELSSERLVVGIPTPGMGEEEFPAWEILNEILLNSESSRAHQDLLYGAQVASSVSGWISGFRHPGMLHLDVTMKPGLNAEKALELLDSHLRAIANGETSERELEKACAKLEADLQRQKLTAGGLAHSLGMYACTLGDYTHGERLLEQLRSVRLDELQAAASRACQKENRVVLFARTEGAQ